MSHSIGISALQIYGNSSLRLLAELVGQLEPELCLAIAHSI